VNYQEMLARLQSYWADHGCVVMQPYHTEVGAGTFNPATFLRCLGPRPWKTAYVEPVIRPLDGRYGENPYRFQHYFQYQVILKPQPADVLELYGLEAEVAVAPLVGAAAATVLACLADGPAGADELTRSTGLDPAELAAALTELELGALVGQADGLYRGVGPAV